MTEQQQRQACAELARMIGWTPPTSYDTPWPERFLYWLSPDGQSSQEDPPDYLTDPVASWELRLWLAADDARWAKLKQQLTALWGSAAEQDLIRFALTLPCKTIARAACKALGIEVSE